MKLRTPCLNWSAMDNARDRQRRAEKRQRALTFVLAPLAVATFVGVLAWLLKQ